MSAKAKSLIIAAFGLLLALILGAQLGESSDLIPFAVAGVCIGTFIYVAFFRTVRFEALILAFLLFGYIAGNRGFAQISIQRNSPLYFGEVGMLCCVFLIAVRRALTREQLIPKISLAWAIVGFLLLGGIRLYLDTVMHGTRASVMLAIRDSAVVYYAIFFFIAYQIGTNASARNFVERAMLAGFVLIIPGAILAMISNEIFYKLTFRGYPLILYKGDLLTTFLGIGSFYFFLTPSKGITKIFLRICSVASLGLMLFAMSRAALFGFACAVILLVIARRPRFLLYQIGIVVIALLAIAFLQFSNIRFESDFPRRFGDKVSSIVDVTATGHYRSEVGDFSAANNEFRTVWWTTVFNETMQKGPVFGLGFGYDLTSSFMLAYFPTGGEDTATTRSPHSIIFTILGRMGVIGLASLLVIIFLTIRMALQTARSVARRKQPDRNLAAWCGAINLLVAAMFGVVLEGPMGGILFWTLLGLGASQSLQSRESQPVEGERSIPNRSDPMLSEAALK